MSRTTLNIYAIHLFLSISGLPKTLGAPRSWSRPFPLSVPSKGCCSRQNPSYIVGMNGYRRKSWPTMLYYTPTPFFVYEPYARMFLTTFSGVSVHRALLSSCMERIDGGDVIFKNSGQFGILHNYLRDELSISLKYKLRYRVFFFIMIKCQMNACAASAKCLQYNNIYKT